MFKRSFTALLALLASASLLAADPLLVNPAGNGTSGNVDPQPVTYPAYNSGDFVACHIVTDNGTRTHTFPASGPNTETIVTIELNHASLVNSNRVVVSAFYWIATSAEASATLDVDVDAVDSYSAWCARAPAGEFNASTPIDSVVGTGGDSDNGATNAPSPTWQASGSAAGGRVIALIGVDADPVDDTPTGWTDLATRDDGAQSATLSQRTALATASEVIPIANWPIAGDSSSSLGYVLLPAAGGGVAPLLTMQDAAKTVGPHKSQTLGGVIDR